MRPDEHDSSYLWDMLIYSRKVVGLVRGIDFPAYQGNETLRLAVERAIEIIGEASRGVSQAFKAAHTEVPWKPIAAQRHIVAHGYAGVVDDKIWRVATQHVPALIVLREPLVPELPPIDSPDAPR
ncbi:hypothetical protein PHYC_00938 [Phycisphaerales bacterium]|nr:hypothetical protein PHYC_00938 [Phycisphaerales bacterium]